MADQAMLSLMERIGVDGHERREALADRAARYPREWDQVLAMLEQGDAGGLVEFMRAAVADAAAERLEEERCHG